MAACNNCFEPGHIARECPKEKMCDVCGAEGHLRAACSEKDGAVCTMCGKAGHLEIRCYQKTRGPRKAKPSGERKPAADGEGAKPKRARTGRRGNTRPEGCFNCLSLEHMHAGCTAPTHCRVCHETGHMGADCARKEEQCAKCDRVGHTEARCFH